MYALYSKNKPCSDTLLTSHGNAFFKVRHTCLRRYVKHIRYRIKAA